MKRKTTKRKTTKKKASKRKPNGKKIKVRVWDGDHGALVFMPAERYGPPIRFGGGVSMGSSGDWRIGEKLLEDHVTAAQRKAWQLYESTDISIPLSVYEKHLRKATKARY